MHQSRGGPSPMRDLSAAGNAVDRQNFLCAPTSGSSACRRNKCPRSILMLPPHAHLVHLSARLVVDFRPDKSTPQLVKGKRALARCSAVRPIAHPPCTRAVEPLRPVHPATEIWAHLPPALGIIRRFGRISQSLTRTRPFRLGRSRSLCHSGDCT